MRFYNFNGKFEKETKLQGQVRIVRGEMQNIEELWRGEIFEGEIRSCFWWTLKELHNCLRSLGAGKYAYKNNIERSECSKDNIGRKVNILKCKVCFFFFLIAQALHISGHKRL